MVWCRRFHLQRVDIQLDELEEEEGEELELELELEELDELEEDILPELLLQVWSCMADDRLFHFEEGPEHRVEGFGQTRSLHFVPQLAFNIRVTGVEQSAGCLWRQERKAWFNHRHPFNCAFEEVVKDDFRLEFLPTESSSCNASPSTTAIVIDQ